MSGWLIAAVTVAYVWVAVEQLLLGNRPMFVVYAGYAFANVGLYILAGGKMP